jgi:hypothetical protein
MKNNEINLKFEKKEKSNKNNFFCISKYFFKDLKYFYLLILT